MWCVQQALGACGGFCTQRYAPRGRGWACMQPLSRGSESLAVDGLSLGPSLVSLTSVPGVFLGGAVRVGGPADARPWECRSATSAEVQLHQ